MRRLPREVWWLASLTVVMALLAFALSSRTSKGVAGHLNPSRSTYNSGVGGLRALYLALGELGYSVRRWRRPFVRETMPPGTLFVVEPTTPLASSEWRSLHQWVEQGNTLVFCAEYTRPGGQEVSDSTTAPYEEVAAREARPTQPTYLAQGVTRLQVKARGWLAPPEFAAKVRARAPRPKPFGARVASGEVSREWRQTLAHAAPVFADREGIVVSFARVGKGDLVLMSSPWSLSNEGLPQEDNFRFALNAAGARPHGVVYFDEYHQGYGESLTWALVPPVGKLALVQALLALFVLGYARSRRFGRVVPLQREDRERSEFLSTLTVVLRRGEATRLAVRTAHEAALRRLRRQLGLPEEAGAEEIGRAAGRLEEKRAARLQAALERCREVAQQQERVSEARALSLVRELDDAERALPRI